MTNTRAATLDDVDVVRLGCHACQGTLELPIGMGGWWYMAHRAPVVLAVHIRAAGFETWWATNRLRNVNQVDLE